METHEATLNLTLSTTSAACEETPSKRHLFLSFQTTQMMAKKDNRHMILPLWDPI